MLMKFNPHVEKMSAYRPPLEGRSKQGLLRLDFNERTLPPCEAVLQAVCSVDLNVYPEYKDLHARLAEYVGVPESRVMTTNGSDQAIDVLFRALLLPGDEIIIPGPSFSIYNLFSGLVGAEAITPEYHENGDFPLEEVLAAISPKVKLITICNPNNPTGGLLSRDGVIQILEAAPQAIVYVDEAYYEFSGETVVDLIEQYPNLVVTRTFSKAFGLSALRIGYVVAQEEILEQMLKIRGPYDVNTVAARAASAALANLSDMQNYVTEVMQESKPMLEAALTKMGVNFLPSQSNYIMLLLDDPKAVHDALAERGILTRPKTAPGGAPALRVSIALREQTQRFISELKILV